jgi:hypothetical protein
MQAWRQCFTLISRSVTPGSGQERAYREGTPNSPQPGERYDLLDPGLSRPTPYDLGTARGG